MSKETQSIEKQRKASATASFRGFRKNSVNLSKLNLLTKEEEQQLDTIYRNVLNRWVETEAIKQ